MSKSYKVEYLEFDEEIVLESAPKPAPRVRDRNRFREFVNNVALAIVKGEVTEETVRQQTTKSVFEAIQIAVARFDELQELYKSESTANGNVNEFLDPEFFTFSYNTSNTTH